MYFRKLNNFLKYSQQFSQKNIPSEMEVAPHYKLLTPHNTLYTAQTVYIKLSPLLTLLILLTLLVLATLYTYAAYTYTIFEHTILF